MTVEVHVGDGVSIPIETERVEEVVEAVLRSENVGAAAISVTFLSDPEIARLNSEYLSHEGPTDVISFPLTQPGGPAVGDVYIGADRAVLQAGELGIDVAEELLRLTVHGTLHVLGYDHPESGERETSPMYLRQEELLRAYLKGDGGAP